MVEKWIKVHSEVDHKFGPCDKIGHFSHRNCCESKLTTAEVLCEGANYFLDADTFEVYKSCRAMRFAPRSFIQLINYFVFCMHQWQSTRKHSWEQEEGRILKSGKKHLVHYSTLLSSHHTELSYSGTCCCLKWETYKLEINSGYSHMCTMYRGFTFVQFCSLLAWCLFEFQPWHDKLSPEQLCILMSVQPTHTHTYMLLM